MTQPLDRADLARHHSFEISVWRDRQADCRAWGWTVRTSGAAVAHCDERALRATADEAWDDGAKRLLEMLRNRAAIATQDHRIVAAGLGESLPEPGRPGER